MSDGFLSFHFTLDCVLCNMRNIVICFNTLARISFWHYVLCIENRDTFEWIKIEWKYLAFCFLTIRIIKIYWSFAGNLFPLLNINVIHNVFSDSPFHHFDASTNLTLATSPKHIPLEIWNPTAYPWSRVYIRWGFSSIWMRIFLWILHKRDIFCLMSSACYVPPKDTCGCSLLWAAWCLLGK